MIGFVGCTIWKILKAGKELLFEKTRFVVTVGRTL
jgi:hypothetical protein